MLLWKSVGGRPGEHYGEHLRAVKATLCRTGNGACGDAQLAGPDQRPDHREPTTRHFHLHLQTSTG
jgi:hypothetical protein